MTEEISPEIISFASTRFGQIEVPAASIITFPGGMIGFPSVTKYVVLEHKPPFSWLHSVENPGLAFVILEAAEFGDNYRVKVPFGDPAIELKQDDEFATLVIVTVRSDPTLTSANLKAPIFINLRNRRGVQVVLDDSRYSTRFLLWSDNPGQQSGDAPKFDKKQADENKEENK